MRIAYAAAEPSGNLPIATSPAMLAHRIRRVKSRIVIEKLYIANQSRARKDRFKQIVAEQSLVRDATLKRLLASVDVVQTSACLNAFAQERLIHVRCRRSVGIDARTA